MYAQTNETNEQTSKISETTPISETNETTPQTITNPSITLTPAQQQAVDLVTSHPSSHLIITGGPGVGKTFTTKTIVNVLEKQGIMYSLCSPTGKAAKRLSEATERPATTIHRLLGVRTARGKSGFTFRHNPLNPLPQQTILVDEASMLDASLMSSLCSALNRKARLILVGDKDQLPSVGPGSILQDLIESKCIPTIILSQVMRQAEGSYIIKNAHAINNGKNLIVHPEAISYNTPHRIIKAFTRQTIKEAPFDFNILNLTQDTDIVAATVKIAKLTGGQVLVPMHKPKVGTKNLNLLLQQELNPVRGGQKMIELKKVEYKTGDKIIYLVNTPKLKIFNGDMGVITDIVNTSEEKYVKAIFQVVDCDEYGHWTQEEKEIKLDGKSLYSFTHSYALTIHKAQGSEWNNVIIPLHQAHGIMLQCNLLYTAVTRAKKRCWLIGPDASIRKAITTKLANQRKTLLKTLMQEEPHMLILDEEQFIDNDYNNEEVT